MAASCGDIGTTSAFPMMSGTVLERPRPAGGFERVQIAFNPQLTVGGSANRRDGKCRDGVPYRPHQCSRL
jgi:hypothetical protein